MWATWDFESGDQAPMGCLRWCWRRRVDGRELSSTPSALRRHRLDAIAATTLSLTRRDAPTRSETAPKSHLMETTARRRREWDTVQYGLALANSFTAFATRRSELPSLRTGLTADPEPWRERFWISSDEEAKGGTS